MRVTVLAFAMQRELLGWKRRAIDLADDSTIEDAWATLVLEFPGLGASGDSIRFARNGSYADRTEPLAEGDELALIPPVAGGASAYRRIELWEGAFPDGLEAELGRAVATTRDGAVVTFVGRTRETPGTPAPGESVPEGIAGQRVDGLAYEAFEPMALRVLGDIADEIAGRFGIERLAMLHRTGEVPLGQASVLIVVAAEHRDAAFDACRHAIEELKARAPIWKREWYQDGSVWVGAPARHAATGHPMTGQHAPPGPAGDEEGR